MTAAYQKIVAMLTDAGGLFVPGQRLASAVGVPVSVINSWMPTVRAQNSHLVIEGARGKGYRIAVRGDPLPDFAPVAIAPRAKPGPKPGAGHQRGLVPLHRRMAANMAILDLLPAKTAELVKTVAAEAGEDVDDALHRLISYGVEVHVDLVNAGENPLGLRRQGIGSRGHQVPA